MRRPMRSSRFITAFGYWPYDDCDVHIREFYKFSNVMFVMSHVYRARIEI